MKKSRLYCMIIAVCGILGSVSCQKEDIPVDGITENENSDDSDDNLSGIHERDADYVWTVSEVRTISLNGTSISISGSGANADGSTLTITAAGNYSLSGTLTNGKIIVNTSDIQIVRLIFKGASITCSNSAPLYISKAEKVLIFLEENTTNSLTDGSGYSGAADNEPNAALFSTANLSIAGTGSLTVKGNYNDGISTKDGLVIKNGILTVSAVDDAIRGKDYVVVHDGTLALTAGGDGLVSDNDGVAVLGCITLEEGGFTITSGGDAIQAVTNMTVSGGDLNLTSGGGSSKTITNPLLSAKGIKAGTSLEIRGGNFVINSADDGLHSGGTFRMGKGTVDVSTADDAIHADGSVTVDGGDLTITKSYEAIESPAITINDGNIRFTATNDGFNATKGTVRGGTEQNDGSMLKITGGYIVSNVSQGDGIDSNGNFEMTGGTLIVHGPQSQPEVGMDVNGSSTISGGFIVITGPNSNMTEAMSTASAQNSVLFKTNSYLSATTLFHIGDADGKELLTFKPIRNYATVLFSSGNLKTGVTYSVYTGGSCTGTLTDGLYTGGTYSGGTQKKSFIISSKVTTMSF